MWTRSGWSGSISSGGIEMSALEKLLFEVVRKHYVPIADPKGCDGAQLLDGEWVMPRWGCDTLQNMIEELQQKLESHEQP